MDINPNRTDIALAEVLHNPQDPYPKEVRFTVPISEVARFGDIGSPVIINFLGSGNMFEPLYVIKKVTPPYMGGTIYGYTAIRPINPKEV